MTREADLSRVLDTGIVAILRANSGAQLADAAEALAAGGVEVLEVTFTVPGALGVIAEVAQRLGDRILLGAGTVLDPETARAALLAGAQFIVTPTLNVDVMRLCRRYGKLVMPGAFTPTEILAAWEAGADLVKVFPSDFVGPGYLKAIHGPLPQIPLMPTGGVNLETAAEFSHGAAALGVGSALVGPKMLSSGNFAELTNLARQFVELVRSTRAALKAGPGIAAGRPTK